MLGRAFLSVLSRPLPKAAAARPLPSRCFVSMSGKPGGAQVAIIGGGVAGLACALELADRGVRATVFDMGTRQPGGRCCSREMGELAFDHGAQLLAPQGDAFSEAVHNWVEAGVAERWLGAIGRLDGAAETFTPWPQIAPAAAAPSAEQVARGFLCSLQPGPVYAGVPSMQAICGHMARQLEESGLASVLLSRKVEVAEWDCEQRVWRLLGSLRGRAAAAEEGVSRGQQEDFGEFQGLVLADSLVAIPGSAGHAQFHGEGAEVTEALQRVAGLSSDPVFTLMVAFEQHLGGLLFDAAAVDGSPFQWVACNSSKPSRPTDGPECWVAVTTPDYARELMQRFPLHVGGKYNPQTKEYLEGVAVVLLQEFERLMVPFVFGADGKGLPKPAYMHAQRWGRGFIHEPLGVPCLAAPQQRFAAAGDFCLGASVEDAWLSGRAAAEAVAAAF